MFFNTLSRPSPQVLRLNLCWPGFAIALRMVAVSCMVLGAVGFIGVFFDLPAFLYPFRPVGMFGGMGLLFAGQVMNAITKLATESQMSFVFDGPAREVRFEAKNPLLPFEKPLPFSEIRQARLQHVQKDGKTIKWRFELVNEDGQFYPITIFLNEKKARTLIREIQMLLGIPLIEEVAPKQKFREYKDAFLKQFDGEKPVREDA